jgi:hypothetical protein
VLSENLARLSQNHFATRHYLLHQVLPVLQKDLEELHDYAQQLGVDEELAAYKDWIENYREVHTTNVQEIDGIESLADSFFYLK